MSSEISPPTPCHVPWSPYPTVSRWSSKNRALLPLLATGERNMLGNWKRSFCAAHRCRNPQLNQVQFYSVKLFKHNTKRSTWRPTNCHPQLPRLVLQFTVEEFFKCSSYKGRETSLVRLLNLPTRTEVCVWNFAGIEDCPVSHTCLFFQTRWNFVLLQCFCPTSLQLWVSAVDFVFYCHLLDYTLRIVLI